ncbi:MAG: RagB/SusD family nutrient uptake outer membrane protein [Bacteroidales bacterium]|nr:RagB/SusD family nutrient uptake outer membrane protein [Bacteroidales bacterium]
MKRFIYTILTVAALASSCTDLEPKVYSNITMEQLMSDAEQNSGYMLSPVYGQMRWFFEDRSVWDLYEIGTDAWVVPINTDGGWNDNGIWQRLNKHEWYTTDPHFSEVWTHLWYGITSCCNRALYQLEEAGVELDEATVAEIKVARAHYYYHLLSFFGNVPIETEFDVPEGYLPETRTRKEVYDFIVSEIRGNMDKLTEEKTYSRFNKWAAKHMLARVYLNAEAWLGPEYASKRDSTIILCDEIIAGGRYSLDDSFSHVFSLDNTNSPEVIFSIPYDETTKSPVLHCIYAKTFHWAGKAVYDAASAGYNGLRAIPSYVEDTFDAEEDPVTHNCISYNDRRYADTYLMGQQYDYVTKEPLSLRLSNVDVPYNHTNHITSPTAAGEFEGYRYGKYEIKIGQKWETDQDWVMYRFGETLMMKAECLLRKGMAEEAAEIVNEVRARSFDENLPEDVRTLTAGQLSATVEVNGVPVRYGEFLNELGREFCGEAMRREQLIRFDDVYTKGSWWGHTASGQEHLHLYPIPDSERITNPKLKQNDGYPE